MKHREDIIGVYVHLGIKTGILNTLLWREPCFDLQSIAWFRASLVRLLLRKWSHALVRFLSRKCHAARYTCTIVLVKNKVSWSKAILSVERSTSYICFCLGCHKCNACWIVTHSSSDMYNRRCIPIQHFNYYDRERYPRFWEILNVQHISVLETVPCVMPVYTVLCEHQDC